MRSATPNRFPFGMVTTFNGQLVPCGGGDPIPLLKATLRIGRSGGCDIALRYPNVSSRHCELSFQNGYWHVRDLGSSNGIRVNGNRCDESFLHPGDELQVARHRYEVVYEADPSAPPPPEEDPFAKSLMEKAGLDRSGRAKSREQASERPTKPPERKPTLPKASQPKPSAQRFDDDEDAAFEMLQ